MIQFDSPVLIAVAPVVAILFTVLALWPGGLMGGRRLEQAAAVQRRV